MRLYTFYSDPGHGWLKIDRQELVKLGIQDKVSSYSYEREHEVFLEEDCDASLFIDAYKAHYGCEPQIKERTQSNSESFIRYLRNYKLEDRPEYGKQYALTGSTGTPCIANGNTWAESQVAT